jgi:sodium transport system permease protein
MNWSDICIVFHKELLQTARNKRTLFIMLSILILQPLMMAGIAKLLEAKLTNRERTPFTLIVVGDDAVWLADWFSKSKYITASIRPAAQLKSSLSEAAGNDSIVLAMPQRFRETLESPAGKLPELIIYTDNRRDNAKQIREVNERLNIARSRYAQARLSKADIPEELRKPMEIRFRSAASEQDRAGAIIGVYLPIALVMLIMTVTLYSSTDLITGERERGTLVLLMVSPLARRDILIGKMLVVVGLSALSGILLILLNVVFLHFAISRAIDTAGIFAFMVPWTAAFLSLALVMPLVLALSAVAMALSSYVRNYQQAQSYYTLMVLLALLPASAQLLPTIEYPPVIAIVPIANISLALRDLFSGQAQPMFIIAAFISSCIYAGLLTYLATKVFDSEHSVFPQDEPASSARGLRRVMAFYLAGVFLVYFTVGQAIQAHDVLPGIIVSQFLLIAAPNLFFARWMNLPVKETLGFIKPRSLRALIAAPFLAPATMAATSSIMFVQDMFLPAPKALEEMMINAIIPPGKSIALVFAAIALTPAICEEILFRGAVQRILLKSLSPKVALVLTAVGFGLFHMSTFRLLPTTLLGLAFSYFSWRQNSIWPTIVLHCCHNGLATALVVYHLDVMSWQGLFVLAASTSIALFLLHQPEPPKPTQSGAG